MHALFDTVLQEARRDYGESGVMRIYISHPKLEKAIIVPPTYLGYPTSELILEHIDNVLYSAGEIPADEDLEINAGIVEFIEGKGRKPITNLDKDIKSKRAFVHIKNTDNSCLPMAIMVGYWHSLAMSDPAYKKLYGKVRDCRGQFQTSKANKLRNAVLKTYLCMKLSYKQVYWFTLLELETKRCMLDLHCTTERFSFTIQIMVKGAF